MNYMNTIIFKEDEKIPVYKNLLPNITQVKKGVPRINKWDIPQTIKQLSYLVHSHYRYYGKFPSVVAGQILEQFSPPSPNHYVLDNFCGSGTTLVEAMLRGINSVGLDISWLSVLASNAKVSGISPNSVLEIRDKIVSDFPKESAKTKGIEDPFASKWFTPETTLDLTTLRQLILNIPKSCERDFLTTAFLAIIRRVSKAYDGEVRPHINKEKRGREVLSAFVKKVKDMCNDHDSFLELVSKRTKAECLLGNNLELPERFNDKRCYLVISHPPYLNSFNYSPVYNLEYYWGKPFEEEFASSKQIQLHKKELKAHPADSSITKKYFDHLSQCYSESFRVQPKGGILAVVIGDCTRKGEVVPVVSETIKRVKSLGYKNVEINYRTTHYGLGKYAYKHRADYHGEDAEKKDAIIIFEKP